MPIVKIKSFSRGKKGSTGKEVISTFEELYYLSCENDWMPSFMSKIVIFINTADPMGLSVLSQLSKWEETQKTAKKNSVFCKYDSVACT